MTWVLIFLVGGAAGSLGIIDDIASLESCKRMELRIQASKRVTWSACVEKEAPVPLTRGSR